MSDIANKDEARKCLAIARGALHEENLDKAEKFALKAQRLYASLEVQSVLEAVEAARAAKRSASGRSAEGGPGSSHHRQPHANANGHAAGHSGAGREHGARAAGTSGPNLPPRKAAEAPKKPVEDPGNPEQRKLVADILAAKDFYATLSLARDATDDDIKKAYRKLALKLHPDKNPALHADEAFKAVGRAFKCLSDADKRAYYDRTGYESSAAASAAAAAQRSTAGHGGYGSNVYYTSADDFDPEELFNMFFGGGFNPHARVFRAQFGGGPRQRNHGHANHGHHGHHGGSGGHGHGHATGGGGASEQQQRAAMLGLLQLMPIVLILLFTFFHSSQSPPYSMSRESSYTVEVLTQRLAVPFYVRTAAELERGYPAGSSARYRLERQVESAYYERLEARCQQERLMRHRAWSWGNREQARAMKLESCDEIERINEKLGMRRQAQSVY